MRMHTRLFAVAAAGTILLNGYDAAIARLKERRADELLPDRAEYPGIPYVLVPVAGRQSLRNMGWKKDSAPEASVQHEVFARNLANIEEPIRSLELELSTLQVDEKSASALLSVLANKELEHLAVIIKSGAGNIIRELAEIIRKNKSLKYLTINGYNCDDYAAEDIDVLAKALSENTTLISLHLSLKGLDPVDYNKIIQASNLSDLSGQIRWENYIQSKRWYHFYECMLHSTALIKGLKAMSLTPDTFKFKEIFSNDTNKIQGVSLKSALDPKVLDSLAVKLLLENKYDCLDTLIIKGSCHRFLSKGFGKYFLEFLFNRNRIKSLTLGTALLDENFNELLETVSKMRAIKTLKLPGLSAAQSGKLLADDLAKSRGIETLEVGWVDVDLPGVLQGLKSMRLNSFIFRIQCKFNEEHFSCLLENKDVETIVVKSADYAHIGKLMQAIENSKSNINSKKVLKLIDPHINHEAQEEILKQIANFYSENVSIEMNFYWNNIGIRQRFKPENYLEHPESILGSLHRKIFKPS